jgi:hypothetical protein
LVDERCDQEREDLNLGTDSNADCLGSGGSAVESKKDRCRRFGAVGGKDNASDEMTELDTWLVAVAAVEVALLASWDDSHKLDVETD